MGGGGGGKPAPEMRMSPAGAKGQARGRVSTCWGRCARECQLARAGRACLSDEGQRETAMPEMV